MLLVVGLQEIFSFVERGDERVDIVYRHLTHSCLVLGLQAAAQLDTELLQQRLHGVFALPVTHALDHATDWRFSHAFTTNVRSAVDGAPRSDHAHWFTTLAGWQVSFAMPAVKVGIRLSVMPATCYREMRSGVLDHEP